MSRLARWLGLAVLGFLGAKLLNLTVNLALFPTLRRQRTAATDGVALLIPVRNEAARLPDTLPGLLSSGAAEIVFLDDESTDGTAALIEAAAAAAGVAVRIVTGTPRPAGWAGKTWACAQLADSTDADVLIFCDADVRLSTGALPAIRAELDRQQADVFSVFPRELTGGWSERLLLPLVEDVLLCFLPFPLLKAPAKAAATANGALLAFRRAGYDQLGGFASVRAAVTEDVAIARRTRREGLALGLALGGDLVGVRMYEDRAGIVAGFGRSLVPAAGGRRWVVATGWVWHLLAYSVPVLLAPFSRRWRWAAALGVAERLLVEAKTGGRDWAAAALVAAAPVAAFPVVAQAMKREQLWKGRRYS